MSDSAVLKPQSLSRSTVADHQVHLLIAANTDGDIQAITETLEESDFNYSYDLATTGAVYKSLLKQNAYDAVLYYNYPAQKKRLSTAVTTWQESGQNIPFILITDPLPEKQVADYVEKGVSHHLKKEELASLSPLLQSIFSQESFLSQESLISDIIEMLQDNAPVATILQRMVDRLQGILGVSRTMISLKEKKEQKVKFVSQETPEGKSLIGNVCPCSIYHEALLSQGQPLICHNLESIEPSDFRELASQYNMYAVLVVPIIHQETELGSICLQMCDHERKWTPQEVNFVKIVANLCGVTLQYSQILQQFQQQNVREELLNEIIRLVNSDLDPEEILNKILWLIGESFDAERVLVFRLSADTISVRQEWRCGNHIPSLLDQQIPIPDWLTSADSGYNFQGHFLAGNSNLVDTALTQSWEKYRASSVLNVPILLHNRIFGGLSVQTITHEREFSANEAATLERTSEYAAIALSYTQNKERLEQLEAEKQESVRANLAKSEFFSTMSHELRTPLTGIMGFARMLRDQLYGELNEKQMEYVKIIDASGEHLSQLIDEVLYLSRLEANREELLLETVSIKEVCLEALTLIPEGLQQRNIQLNLDIEPDLMFCIADKRRLREILVHLLSNAVKFTEEGAITLKVNQVKDEILFSAIDTGIGIAPEEQNKLFKPFHQLKTIRNGNYPGKGLGLALSQELAKLHGGKITVTSEVGRGSCFTLHLPAMEVIG